MESDNSSGLSDYMQWIRRRLPLIVIIGATGLIAAIAIALALPNIYNAPAEFRVSSSSLADASGNESYVDQYVTALTRDVSAFSTAAAAASTSCTPAMPAS